MAERIPQSTTIRVPLLAFLSTDHVTEATGKTIAITISKNGGAFGNPSAGATNATEVGSGYYYVDLSTTDTGTLGPLVVKGSVSGIDVVWATYNVVNANTLGAAALPNAAAEAAGGLYTRGTGAGQINQPANGLIDASIKAILGTTVTEGAAGRAAGSFSTMHNVASPVFTTASVNQTGDNYARLGAPAGASVSADVAAVKAVLPAALVSGRIDASVGAMAADVITASAIATDAIGSAELAASAVSEIQSGLSTLDAAAVRSAVGLASANLDTQLSAIAGYIDTEIGTLITTTAAIKAKTDLIPGTADGYTWAQRELLCAAVLIGTASGLEGTTAVYNALDGSKARITATVDSSGNRSAVTRDAT